MKQLGAQLPDTPEESAIPEVGELNELQTFVGSKKPKSGARSAINHFTQGVNAWVLGAHSAETFKPLGKIVQTWKSYFDVHSASGTLSQSMSQSQIKKKASKGTVVVQVFKERLRLCWSYLGKRYYL